eukprot:scaffold97780_cov34-Prasinocladus_malaysianus.AAC.1
MEFLHTRAHAMVSLPQPSDYPIVDILCSAGDVLLRYIAIRYADGNRDSDADGDGFSCIIVALPGNETSQTLLWHAESYTLVASSDN